MRHLSEFLFWEAACAGVWLLTTSSISTPDLVAALVCALPCAVLAVVARQAVGGSWLPRAAWTRWLLPLPVAVAADWGRLLRLAAGALVGRRIGSGEVRPVELTRDRAGRVWRARQAATVLLVSATPSSMILDVDPDDATAVLHSLGSGRPRMEEVVRR